MGSEQRKNIRFLVKDNIIAALRNGLNKIVRIRDISLGGLSFEHIYDEDLGKDLIKKDIFLFVKGVCMLNVPCEIVYNIPEQLTDEYQNFGIQLISRRCGVKFQTLLEDQRTQLDFFIKTQTIGATPY